MAFGMLYQMYTDGEENMTVEQFRDLLMAVYKLAMDYYPEGPQTCRQLFKTLQAVTDSAVSMILVSNMYSTHVIPY